MAEKKEEILEEEKEQAGAGENAEAAEKENAAEAMEEEAAEDAADSGDTAEGEETSGAGEKNGEKDGGEKKGFFKKKKDKKDEQIEELTDRIKRQMAEFENFRKRTEKEKTQMYDMGARSIAEKILPVIDNFERGLAGVPEEQKEDAFVVGMDKTYRQMLAELEMVGVTPIEALGREFDPEYHNAVMQVESEELEAGMVAQELQKGYMYKDSVLRHSMVAVVS